MSWGILCSQCLFCFSSDLSRIKGQAASKYGLTSQPRLVDIIAAVPPAYKKVSSWFVWRVVSLLCYFSVLCTISVLSWQVLLPKLKAKPVRTASGVSMLMFITYSIEGNRLYMALIELLQLEQQKLQNMSGTLCELDCVVTFSNTSLCCSG